MLATFARSGVAYKQDGSQVADGIPRYETGLYGQAIEVEEGTTNLAQYSQEFDNAWWAKIAATIAANDTTAPDGTLTADRIIENSVIGGHGVDLDPGPLTAGQPASVSCFAKAATRSFFEIQVGVAAAVFDLSAGTVGVTSGSPSATITSFGNGWYRCTISKTSVSDDYIYLLARSLNSTANYIGDGSSGIYIWGAQAEVKAYPTSYVATTSATVTRNAETLTVPTSGIFTKSAWTTELSYKPYVASGPASRILWEVKIDANNYYRVGIDSSNRIYLTVASGGTPVTITRTGAVAVATWYSIGASGDGATMILCVNGSTVSTAAYVEPAGTLPANMYVGCDSAGANQADGLLDDFRTSNTAHSAAAMLADFTAGPLQYE